VGTRKEKRREMVHLFKVKIKEDTRKKATDTQRDRGGRKKSPPGRRSDASYKEKRTLGRKRV